MNNSKANTQNPATTNNEVRKLKVSMEIEDITFDLPGLNVRTDDSGEDRNSSVSIEVEDACLRMGGIKISFEGSEEVVTNLVKKVGNTVASMATKGGEKRNA